MQAPCPILLIPPILAFAALGNQRVIRKTEERVGVPFVPSLLFQERVGVPFVPSALCAVTEGGCPFLAFEEWVSLFSFLAGNAGRDWRWKPAGVRS